jgi:hypothetical protein
MFYLSIADIQLDTPAHACSTKIQFLTQYFNTHTMRGAQKPLLPTPPSLHQMKAQNIKYSNRKGQPVLFHSLICIIELLPLSCTLDRRLLMNRKHHPIFMLEAKHLIEKLFREHATYVTYTSHIALAQHTHIIELFVARRAEIRYNLFLRMADQKERKGEKENRHIFQSK